MHGAPNSFSKSALHIMSNKVSILAVILSVTTLTGVAYAAGLIPRIWLPFITHSSQGQTSCTPGRIYALDNYTTYIDNLNKWHLVGEICNGMAESYSDVRTEIRFLDLTGTAVETHTFILNELPISDSTNSYRQFAIVANRANCFHAQLDIEPFGANSIVIGEITATYTATISSTLAVIGSQFDISRTYIHGRAQYASDPSVDPSVETTKALYGALYSADGKVLGCKAAAFNSNYARSSQVSFGISFADRGNLFDGSLQNTNYKLWAEKMNAYGPLPPTAVPNPPAPTPPP